MTRDEVEQRRLLNIQKAQKRLEETILLVIEFLVTNASDIDLAKKVGMSSSTVGRRLTNQSVVMESYNAVKENMLKMGFKEDKIPQSAEELFDTIHKKRQENLLRGKALGGQTTLINHVYLKGEDTLFKGATKLSLNAFYSDKEKQYRFLANAALYFRLHLDTLSTLFQIEEKEILDNMIRICSSSYDALKILFYHDTKDQNVARINFMNYYRELLDAVRNKKLDDKKRLISLIGDSKAINLKKNRCPGDKLSDNDIEILIRYQLKYALTNHDIAYIFEIDRNNYVKRVTKFLSDKDNLRHDYECLMDFNSLKYQMGVQYETKRG